MLVKYGSEVRAGLTQDSVQRHRPQESSPPSPGRGSRPPPWAPQALPVCRDDGTVGTSQDRSLRVPVGFWGAGPYRIPLSQGLEPQTGVAWLRTCPQ